MLAKYRKALAPFAGLVALIVGTELGTDSKWYSYAVALLVALGVYAVPNRAA